MTSPDPTHSEKHLRQQAHRSFAYALEAGMKELTQALLAEMIRAEYSPDGPFPPHAYELLAGAWDKIFAAQRNQWQPIETCPDDVREALLLAGTYRFVGERWPSDGISDGVWMDGEYIMHKPTHWMPLPEPPKVTP
jgi:hypothetical protein